MNDLWDEALGHALETAGAFDVYAALSQKQRDVVSDALADWSESMESGGPSLPSNPEASSLRSEVAELRYQLARAERSRDTYRHAVGRSDVGRLDADAMVENALRRVTR